MVSNYNFIVSDDASYQLDDEPSIGVFPARTKGPVTLDYFANTPQDVTVRIVKQEDESKVIEEHVYHNFSRGALPFDLSYLPKTRVYIKVFVEGKEIFKNRIRIRE